VSLNISKTFEDIISHPWGQNAFVKFLETEFSLENWLFKENVLNYQKFASEQLRAADDTTNLEAKMAVRAKFEESVTEFINEDGVYTVNISGQMGEKIQKTIHHWNEMTNDRYSMKDWQR
jgi:hypothetical protein